MAAIENVNKSQREYLPAAGRDIFLPLYDIVAKLLGADHARESLIVTAQLTSGDRVLDIGCGTGTFAVLLKQRFPSIEVVGLDPDQRALARARKKAEGVEVLVHFDQGFADSLDYPAASFDAVFSSFMFHHLQARDREAALREVRRVLKPMGSFYLLDFDRSEAESGHGLFRMFHSSERLQDNSESRIVSLMGAAGFSDIKKENALPVLFGFSSAGLYHAVAP